MLLSKRRRLEKCQGDMSKEKINQVIEYLNDHEISFTRYDHPPVFTIEESKKHWANVPGMHCKNLFLRDDKSRYFFLLCCEGSKQVDLKSLRSIVGYRLGFASERRLDQFLKLTPGSVSPFGLINDADNKVQVLLDSNFRDAELLNFHPNINTCTLEIELNDFIKYMDGVGNEWKWVDV